MRPYIPVDINDLPEEFSFDISGNEYIFGINYNSMDDSFSVDLYDNEYNPIVINEPVVLDKPLWEELIDTRLPNESIIPMDESNQATEVNGSNFGNSVQLYLDILASDKDGNPIPDDSWLGGNNSG